MDRATFDRWWRRGQQQERGRYRDFCDALERAAVEAKIRVLEAFKRAALEPRVVVRERTKRLPDGREIVETITETRPPDWKAVAWYLERRYPEEFGRR